MSQRHPRCPDCFVMECAELTGLQKGSFCEVGAGTLYIPLNFSSSLLSTIGATDFFPHAYLTAAWLFFARPGSPLIPQT